MIGVLALAGCGRIGFDGATAVGVDDAADATGDDAANAGCSATPFTSIVQQTNLASANEDWEPTLSPDGLHVIFQSQRNAVRQLFYSSRTSVDGTFSAAVLLGTNINADGDDSYAPHWARDGHFEYEHQVVVGGTRHVVALTVDTSGDMPVFGPATEIDTDPNGSQIVETSNGLERFLTQQMGASPNTKQTLIYQQRSSTSATWGDRALPSTFNATGVGNNDGYVTYDEVRHELWWERGRPGTSSIVSATRSAEGAMFDALVTTHTELGDSGDPDLSADGMAVAFAASDLVGFTTVGANDIFTATRACR